MKHFRHICCVLMLIICLPSPGQASTELALLQVQKGSAALIRGDYTRAITLFDRALKVKGLAKVRRANIFNDRAVAKWRLSRTKEAVGDFNEAISLYPEYAVAYNNRGNVLIELGLFKEAVKDFDQAILLSPSYGAAYNNRANAHLKLRDYDAAYQDYTKAINLMPNNATPINGRGRVHEILDRSHAAVRDYSRAIS